MKERAAFGALSLAIAGWAVATTSNLPVVDVSRMENGKALSASEVDAAVRGKQMVGDTIRSNGSNTYNVLRVYEANGTLRGAVGSEADEGKWYVKSETNELCNTWTRWAGGCYKLTVRNGKLYQQNPVSGTQYIQK